VFFNICLNRGLKEVPFGLERLNHQEGRIMQLLSKGICCPLPTAISVTQKSPVQKKERERKLSTEELLKRYAAGERNFCGVDLSGQLLRGVDLSGANLLEAKLHNTHLEQANLTGVNLSRADLHHVSLTGAILTGANLTESSLHQVNLQDANLRGADLSGASLRQIRLVGADLGGAILPDGSILLTSKLESRLQVSRTKKRKETRIRDDQ
jgi:uncharacterized protein YjbI with pentapeptide repeats